MCLMDLISQRDGPGAQRSQIGQLGKGLTDNDRNLGLNPEGSGKPRKLYIGEESGMLIF